MLQDYIPTAWAAEARGQQVQGHSEIQSAFNTSLGNLARLCFKIKK